MTTPSVWVRVKRVAPGPLKRLVRRRLEKSRFLRRHVLSRLETVRPLVPAQELQHLYVDALRHLLERRPTDGLGDYVEFGVCHGTSMICMARASRLVGVPGMRLLGFDSFEGLPDEVVRDDGGHWRPGQFLASERTARENLARAGVEMDRVVLVKGWFDDTATPAQAAALDLHRIAVAMIDCDAYSSARTALRFVAPLLADRAVLVFDDWHSGGLGDRGQGERRAYEQMLEEHPDLREVERLAPYAPSAVVVLVERRPAPPDDRPEADATTPAALSPAVLTNASRPPGTPSGDRATR